MSRLLLRRLHEIPAFTAGDKTVLRELLHPDNTRPFSGRYSLAHASLAVGEESLRHALKTSEVYYILAGEGLLTIDDESTAVTAGDCIEIPPHAIQSIRNTGTVMLSFLCIVDPAWKAADEVVFP